MGTKQKLYKIKVLDEPCTDEVIKLVHQLNQEQGLLTLKQRYMRMRQQNYNCVGIFDKNKLIGLAGYWISTRFYCGKFLDIDNFVIDQDVRSQGIGTMLLEWLENEARRLECENIVLDAYVHNNRSHKFYFKHDYKILGFHFIKKL